MPTALITGASSGIGAVFARKLAAKGYDLILIARREDRLRALAAELPVRAEIVVADLATEEGLAAATAHCSQLDLLINNAGFGSKKRFWEADLARQEEMHRLHVLATVRLTHAALAPMVERARGAVINVASVAAFGQGVGSVSYCATKAWMKSFTKGLEMELRSVGSPVQAQALCPGFTHSEFHDVVQIDRAKIPGILWMSAEDVVDESLRALDRRQCVVVPGLIYRIGVLGMKLLPEFITQRTGTSGRRDRV